jgi:hypothetical protein
MNRTLELPEPVYEGLVEAARAVGTTPADWIARRLSESRSPRPQLVSEEERRTALAGLLSHCVSLGYPTGSDNEQIDSDLAREYGDDHSVSMP